MKIFTLAIYCFLDDLLQKMDCETLDKRRKLNDAQIITIVILSAKYFYGNQTSACAYLQAHYGFQMPDKSNFNRMLHRLTNLMADIFFQLGLIFKHLNLESVYIIDSFPVPVCKNIRIAGAKILQGEEFRGYNASKREYFYGFKVHLISTAEGIPVEFMVSAGSIHDNTALQIMDIHLPANSDLYGDAAYLNQEICQNLLEFEQIRLKAATKSNSVLKNTWAQELENKYFRKRIENSFAEVNAKFPKKIHAVTAEGFLIKILGFILMFCLDKHF
jgi:hypothetical protein